MSTKRTDKILDLLDAGLQSTTPLQTGMQTYPDRCCGCERRAPVEGRSWCEHCLPELDVETPESTEVPEETSEDVPPWSSSTGWYGDLLTDPPPGLDHLATIHLGPTPDDEPIAIVGLDVDGKPVGFGLNVVALFAVDDLYAVLDALDRVVLTMVGPLQSDPPDSIPPEET